MVPNVILVPHYLNPNPINGISYELLKDLSKLESVILAEDFGKYIATQKYFRETFPWVLRPEHGDSTSTSFPIVGFEVLDIHHYNDMVDWISTRTNGTVESAYVIEAMRACDAQLAEWESIKEINGFQSIIYNNELPDTENPKDFIFKFLHFDGLFYYISFEPATDVDTQKLDFWKAVINSMDAIPHRVCVSSRVFKIYERCVHKANERIRS